MNLQKGQAYPRVRSATGEGKANPSADKIMIICEVLEISPYELLLDTDSKNPGEHRQTEYVVINRKSKEYELIRMYEKLDSNAQKRLEGYMHALGELK